MHSDLQPSRLLRCAAWGGIAFLHLPILVVALYAFNTETSAFSFPPKGFTLHWFADAWARDDMLAACWPLHTVTNAITLPYDRRV